MLVFSSLRLACSERKTGKDVFVKALLYIGARLVVIAGCLWLIISCGLDNKGTTPRPTTSPFAVPTKTSYYAPQPSTPPYISAVAPSPGSILNMQDFRDGKIDEGERWQAGISQPICLKLEALWLARPGDDLSNADLFLEHVEFIVDDQLLPRPDWIEQLIDLVSITFPEGGDTALVGGPFFFCWKNDLNAGTHIAHFKFHKTSGEVAEYQWSFILADD